ncbi:TetR/AcrR family transcriptional regulator [Nocardia sp. NPDC057668]|uniref:TetR/AcrR family transcriptional regulator n=1 Tax=Nocardia sp. NPDC057668 TaxID=3346202 RepID=UPI00366C9FBB
MTAELVDHHEEVPPSRGTAARMRRALRRQQVISAASTLFDSAGYHAATMTDIAALAGWSKPIVYRQFSGKLELYLVVLQEHIDNLTQSVERALYSNATNRYRVQAAVQAYFDFADQQPAGFRLVLDPDLSNEPSVQWRIGRATDACVNAVTAAIAHDSDLSPVQAHLMASGLVGASQFAARYWLDTGRSMPKADAVAGVVTLCWGGLAAVPLRAGEESEQAEVFFPTGE